MKKITFVLTLLLIGSISYLNAQKLVPKVTKAAYYSLSKPLRNMTEADNDKIVKTWKDGLVKNYFGKTAKDYKPNQKTEEKSIQRKNGKRPSKSMLINFDGMDNQSQTAPPDTDGDVGPNHYFQVVNQQIQIFDKSGNSLYGPVNTSTLWSGFSGDWSGTNDGDGIVLYDQQADRWFVSQFAVNTLNQSQWILVAISQTGDPTGSYHRYAFQFEYMPDYPKFGIWSDGYYVSVNQFEVDKGSRGWIGAGAAVLERDAMLSGNPDANMIFFDAGAYVSSLLPADCDSNFPAEGTPNYFSWIDYAAQELKIYEFNTNWETPSNSTFTNVTNLEVDDFDVDINGSVQEWSLDNIEQPGTSQKIHAMTDRLMYRLQYLDFGTHESMVTCHTIDVGNERAGIRWYELRKEQGAWTIYQQSTYAPDTKHRWMGSIAMNHSGDIALGYSVADASTFPSIRYTGRHANDPLNTMTIEETEIIAGEASQTGIGRWGDYSSMRVDPIDNKTFWYTQEYSKGGWDWQTRIAAFKYPSLLDPQVTVQATSHSEIELNWTKNSDNNDVMIAYSTSSDFGTPKNGNTYAPGQNIQGGGTVIYVGDATNYTHSNLIQGTKYYYKAWSILNSNPDYSEGTLYSITTPKESLFFDDFETDKNWTFNGEWERGNPQGKGGDHGSPDPTAAYSGNNILGLDLSGQGDFPGDYETNIADRAEYAYTPIIDCSNYEEIELNFKRWLGVEGDYDHAYIDISKDGGNTWTEIWANPLTTISESSWSNISIDISNHAENESQVMIRFSIGATDVGWQYCGWNIDDFSVTGINKDLAPVANISFEPACNEGKVTITSNKAELQTFYLCNENGDVISQETKNAISHTFINVANGTYTGKIERNSVTSPLTTPITLVNATPPVAPTEVTLSETTICPGDPVTLSCTGGSGANLMWYTESCGGNFVGKGNNFQTNPQNSTTYYARWENTCGATDCVSADLTVYDAITVNAGSDDQTCDNLYTLNANTPSDGTGTWSAVEGNASFESPNDPNSNVTFTERNNILRWTITDDNCSVSDEVNIIYQSQTQIISQPDDVTAEIDSEVEFSVEANGENLTYQWRKNGINLSESSVIQGVKTKNLTIKHVSESLAGNYDVIVTGDCGEVTSEAASLNVTSGIETLKEMGVKVYPNPVNNILKIDTKELSENSNLRIVNVTGQTIFKGGLYKNRTYELDFSNYPAGIYFLTIKAKRKTHTVSIIKK